jgi:small subunit ribosomal protein S2
MSRIPAALFIVDINKEKIAVAEARKLNIPTFAMTDTNTDPTLIDFPIPANDDASKSIYLILNYVVSAVADGLSERQAEREKSAAEKKEKDEKEDALKEARLKADIKTKSENLRLAEEQADIEAEKKKAKVVKKASPKKRDDNDD